MHGLSMMMIAFITIKSSLVPLIEARNADERSGMQARGTKQRELVEDPPRVLPWIESGSLVRDFWSAVEYGGIPEFLGSSKLEGTH